MQVIFLCLCVFQYNIRCCVSSIPDQQGFTELIQLLLDLIPDREATDRLFDALTLGERTGLIYIFTIKETVFTWFCHVLIYHSCLGLK